jgi:hypothetical protein
MQVATMNIARFRHRGRHGVPVRRGFDRTASLVDLDIETAMACAENEGWPVRAEWPDPLLAMAGALAVVLIRRPVAEDPGDACFRIGPAVARQFRPMWARTRGAGGVRAERRPGTP